MHCLEIIAASLKGGWGMTGGQEGAMYDTARVALQGLTDDELFERVALRVLRTRFPEPRITGPSSDLNRDAFGRPLFGS